MKKLIISIMFLSLIIPFSTYAISADSATECNRDGVMVCTIKYYVASSSDALQAQIADLRMQNLNLQARINNLEKVQPVSAVPTDLSSIQSQINTSNAKITEVEIKVGTLEKAVNILQTSVINTLNKTIDLLKQLLKI